MTLEEAKAVIQNTCCIKGMKGMLASQIDLTVTSPPYDSLRHYEGNSDFDFQAVAQELYRITKPGGVVVWVVGDETRNGNESGTSFEQALYFKSIGFSLWDTMIYEKGPKGAVGDDRGYWQAFEYMFVFAKGNRPKTIDLIHDRMNLEVSAGGVETTKRRRDGSFREMKTTKQGLYGRRTNIWRIGSGFNLTAKDKVAYEHPAVFPEALARDHIRSWSKEGDLVFDPFSGSGTTAVMAIKYGRRFLGFEINARYCELARERLVRSQEQIMIDF